MSGARPSQRGSATVLAVVLLAGLCLATALAAALGGLLVARRRAAAAADLAALAGAAAVQRGGVGCPTAGSSAAANHASLVRCRVHAGVVEVEVTVQTWSLLGVTSVHDRARAGPADRGG